ncbi:tail fiber protein [Algoriphagus sp. SE2]|uniref:phage tail protein n=1 Tax=Algoriphagus sp. SE2 TaxID=3141536 RepID=UPI0031CD396E
MEPFLGQITMFGGTFAPRGWAFCEGQLIAISTNTALFSLLGTTYGGDGRTTFALPDLRGRCAIGYGSGPGLQNHNLGAKVGSESVVLNESQIPSHTHPLMGSNSEANTNDPTNGTIAKENVVVERGSAAIPVNGYSNGAANVNMKASIGNTGGSQAHTNMQPSLAMNYIIAIVGVYPSRS